MASDNTHKKSRTPYYAHRRNQREKILTVAKRLFIKKGIHFVTISHIAASTHLTRATIYKYFSNRKEIAFEIFKIILAGWRDRGIREVWTHTGNGIETLELFLKSYGDALLQFPEETSFIAEFNYLYAREWPSKQVLGILRDVLSEDQRQLLSCIQRGIEDGSLRPDIEPGLMVAAIYNLNTSLLGRLGQMRQKVREEYGIGPEIIFPEIYRVFLEGIRNRSGITLNGSSLLS